MLNWIRSAGGAALLLALWPPASAWASDTDIFASCDSLGKPGGSAHGMSSPANTMRFGGFHSSSEQATIDACNQALAHRKLLPGQTLRRAHLLRARAIARLRGSDLTGALGDIDLAGAAVAETDKGPLFKRSMAVSLNLLRALIYDSMGNAEEALRLVRQSAADRPYSWEVQRVAAHLLLVHGVHDDEAKSIIARAGRLDPDFVQYQINVLLLSRDFKAMAGLSLPSGGSDAVGTVDALGLILQSRERITSGLILAYAYAATGDTK